MSKNEKKYRFILINPFTTPSRLKQTKGWSKEKLFETGLRITSNHYKWIKQLLEDVEWDYHIGALYGLPEPFDFPVANREDFAYSTAARLPLVREACESGKYNAIVLLGGGQPGFLEAVEIARPYGIPVTACAYSQFHIATMLGNKFSVIDVSEEHIMFYYNLVVQTHMTQRCASIRSINTEFPRDGYENTQPLSRDERVKAERGERSELVERAVSQAVAAIEQDGAEVITCGCSGSFWLQPFMQSRLTEMGWEVPVLEGYSSAIVLAKLLVNLGVVASGLWFPDVRPKKRTPRKIF